MAEIGRREAVGDQLAFNAREVIPDRSLPLSGVRGNNSTNNALFKDEEQTINAMTGLRQVMSKRIESAQEDAMLKGKTAFMSGVTEVEMRKNNDYYERLGYESLNAVNKANQWFLNEQIELQNGTSADMSPEDYQKYLAGKNKELFSSLPDDPALKKIYLAAYSDLAPKLGSAQVQAHSARNYEKQVNSFGEMLDSGVSADSTRPRRTGPSDLAISDTIISQPYEGASKDRDIAIKTMLGEAGGETDVGLAAVAHVLLNRSRDSRWGGSISDVALAPKQFSTWNKGAGGNNPGRYRPGTAAYERAGRIYDAVTSGRTQDPTGGATHYYSPAGMQHLVAGGSQNNLIPRWLRKEAAASGGEIKIGGHIFVGKSRGSSGGPQMQGPKPEDVGNDISSSTEVELDDAGLPAQVDPEAQAAKRKQMEANAPMHVVGEDAGRADAVANSGAAPAAVAAEAGIATDETKPKYSSVSLATIKEGVARLKPGDGAKEVVKNIALQLSNGRTDLYDTIGGHVGIRELGGSSEDAYAIQSAYEAYTKQQEAKFSADTEAKKDAIIRDVEMNPDASLETTNQQIAALIDQKLISQQEGGALASRAAESFRNRDQGTISIPMQREVMGNIANMKMKLTANMTQEEFADVQQEFAENTEAIAQRYGLEPNKVQQYTQRVFAEAEQERDRLIAAAKSAHDKGAKTREVIGAVNERISQGRGTKGIRGTATVDGRDYNPEELYVKQVTDRAREAVAAQYPPGTDSLETGAAMDKIVYTQLIKGQVPDAELGADLASATSGELINKDGTVRQLSVQALDKYARISKMAGGAEWLSSTLPEGTKAFLDNAMNSYAGDGDLDSAIRVAYQERLRVQQDPNYKMQKDQDFTVKLPVAVAEATKKVLSTENWFTRLMGGDVFNAEQIRASSAVPVQNWLRRKADQLQMNDPSLSAESALKTATDSMQDNSVIVGNNVKIADRPEERLDRVMGLESIGRDAPNIAVSDFLSEIGLAHWGKDWSDRSYTGAMPKSLNPFPSSITDKTPKYEVQVYDRGAGRKGLRIGLWKDQNDRGKGLLDKFYDVDAEAVGKRYIDKINERSVAAPFVDSVRDFFSRGAGGKFLFERQTPTWQELTE